MAALALGSRLRVRLPRIPIKLVVGAVQLSTPVVLYVALGLPQGVQMKLATLAVGVGAIVALAAVPGFTLVLLCSTVLLVDSLLALVLRIGVPAGVVGQLSSTKEALVAALMLAAGVRLLRNEDRLDRVDIVALVYVGLAMVWFVFSSKLPDPVFVPADVKIAGLRTSVIFAMAFVAARRAGIETVWVRRAGLALIASTVVLAVSCFVQQFARAQWATFSTDFLQIGTYFRNVQGSTRDVLSQTERVGTTSFTRVSGLAYEPLTAAFSMLVGVGLAVERSVRQRLRPLDIACLAMLLGGIIATNTRSAVLGAAAAVLVSLALPAGARIRRAPIVDELSTSWGRAQARRRRAAKAESTARRGRLIAVLVAGAFVVLPLLAQSGVIARFAGAVNGEDTRSAPGHQESLRVGLDGAISHPLGRGVATGGSTANRAGLTPIESYPLQVANELGVAGLALYLAFFFGAVRVGLRSGAREARAAAIILVSELVASIFLPGLDFVTVNITVFAFMGAAIAPGVLAAHAERSEGAVDEEVVEEPSARFGGRQRRAASAAR